MKVLISAYSCEPGQGSERGVGWNVVREVAKRHKVWVLTRPDESKEAIEAELTQNPIPNLQFVYFTLPFWQDSLRWGQSGAMQIHYYLWQIQAYFVGKKLHQEIQFDLCHHVTFVKYSSPSFLSFLPIPFIWGPVGGGESAPRPFHKDFSTKASLYEIARSLTRRLGELDPFVRATIRNSSIVRSTTEDTAQRLRQMGAGNVQVLPAVGLLQEEVARLGQSNLPADEPVRFLSLGRLLHWKGFHLGLQAFAQANLPNAEYWIIGEGPERSALEQIVTDCGLTKQVKFLGLLPRSEAFDRLLQCHCLVHPSLHDSGGYVCLEAMAAGRPVICLDLGGPAVQVTNQTGFKVDAHAPDQAIKDIAKAMQQLANNPTQREQMSGIGKQRILESSWEQMGEQLETVYQKATRPTSKAALADC